MLSAKASIEQHGAVDVAGWVDNGSNAAPASAMLDAQLSAIAIFTTMVLFFAVSAAVGVTILIDFLAICGPWEVARQSRDVTHSYPVHERAYRVPFRHLVNPLKMRWKRTIKSPQRRRCWLRQKAKMPKLLPAT